MFLQANTNSKELFLSFGFFSPILWGPKTPFTLLPPTTTKLPMWNHWTWSWEEMHATAYHFMISSPKIKNTFILKYWVSNNQLVKIPQIFNNLCSQIGISCLQHTTGCNNWHVVLEIFYTQKILKYVSLITINSFITY